MTDQMDSEGVKGEPDARSESESAGSDGPPPDKSVRKRKAGLRGVLAAAIVFIALAGVVFRVWHYDDSSKSLVIGDGRVAADAVCVSAAIPGKIEIFAVEEGARIEKGGLIAQLDKTDLQAQADSASTQVRAVQTELDEARGSLGAAAEKRDKLMSQGRAGLDDARRRLERAQAEQRSLTGTQKKNYTEYRAGTIFLREEAQNRFIQDRIRAEMAAAKKSATVNEARLKAAEKSSTEIEGMESKVAGLERSLSAARTGQSAADKTLASAMVVSPVRGMVAKKMLKTGDAVEAGKPVAVVLDLDRVRVEAGLPEAERELAIVGRTATIQVEGSPKKSLAGKIAEVGGAASSEPSCLPEAGDAGAVASMKGRIPVKISADDPERLLQPGASVTIIIDRKAAGATHSSESHGE